jgi:hypothetical protein
MKKILILIPIIIGIVIFACNKAGYKNIDTSTANVETSLEPAPVTAAADGAYPGCPKGFRPVISWDINKFNFHKPRTECGHGFGVCLDLTKRVECVPENFTHVYITEDGTIGGYGDLKESTLVLHLPADLTYDPAFVNENMETFEIEADHFKILDGEVLLGTLKGGIYPVVNTGTELLIEIPFN